MHEIATVMACPVPNAKKPAGLKRAGFFTADCAAIKLGNLLSVSLNGQIQVQL